MGLVDPTVLSRLTEVVGPAHVLTDPEVTAGFGRDWTGRFSGVAPAVVSPGDEAETAAVVQACREAGVALVPQGGNTGLVGGGVPLHGEVVLSLRRLRTLVVDAVAGQATVGAGTTVGELHRAAAEAGWAYGVDLGSRGSATVGGTIATNAGGLRVLRYGDTRAQVLGVAAVLGDGSTVSHLAGLVKDNTGYHLPSLLCGSEGTLGVVTTARVRLVPAAPYRAVALLGLGGVGGAGEVDGTALSAGAAGALEVVSLLRRVVPTLSAAELFLDAGLSLVMAHAGLPPPLTKRYPVYLLVEASGVEDPLPGLAEALASAPGVADAAVAEDPERARALWRYREGHTEAVNAAGVPHKLDVTLPLEAYAEAVATVPALVAAHAPGARTWLFGHLAEGNLHVNITGVDPEDVSVDEAVLALVAERGGSVSAEHGIGTAKRDYLSWARSAAEIAAFRAIKAALDPDGILNPNVLLPPAPST